MTCRNISLPTKEKFDPKKIVGCEYLCTDPYFFHLLQNKYPGHEFGNWSRCVRRYKFHEDYFTLIVKNKYKLDIKYSDPNLNNSFIWLE